MKIVIAIDSFKGSVSSIEAGNAAKSGILRAFPEAEVIVLPLADGGEGTADAMRCGLGGEVIICRVHDPLGKEINAGYVILNDGRTAVIEMAAASGLPLLSSELRNPMVTSTYGTGELMLDAMQRGCRHIIMGIGGSATNDGGMGMLSALGVNFYDNAGKLLPGSCELAGKVKHIDLTGITVPADCTIEVACDVQNPLCGPTGASYIFGPQKGATPELLPAMDMALAHFAEVSEATLGEEYTGFSKHPGTGAAGGMGFALKTYLGAELRSGAELICRANGLSEALTGADIFITGEGRLDAQTAMGKAPSVAAGIAHEKGCFVVGLCGCCTEDALSLNNGCIDAFFPVLMKPCTLTEAMDKATATANIARTAEQAIRLFAHR